MHWILFRFTIGFTSVFFCFYLLKHSDVASSAYLRLIELIIIVFRNRAEAVGIAFDAALLRNCSMLTRFSSIRACTAWSCSRKGRHFLRKRVFHLPSSNRHHEVGISAKVCAIAFKRFWGYLVVDLQSDTVATPARLMSDSVLIGFIPLFTVPWKWVVLLLLLAAHPYWIRVKHYSKQLPMRWMDGEFYHDVMIPQLDWSFLKIIFEFERNWTIETLLPLYLLETFRNLSAATMQYLWCRLLQFWFIVPDEKFWEDNLMTKLNFGTIWKYLLHFTADYRPYNNSLSDQKSDSSCNFCCEQVHRLFGCLIYFC